MRKWQELGLSIVYLAISALEWVEEKSEEVWLEARAAATRRR